MEINYNEIWNKIRDTEIEEMDFFIRNGVDKRKKDICDYFYNNYVLKSFFIDKMKVTEISKALNYKGINSSHKLIIKEVMFYKMELAEEGVFDDLEDCQNANYYKYIRERIKKHGITSVYVYDGINTSDISKAIGVEPVFIKEKIIKDRKKVGEYIKDLGIKRTRLSTDLYIKIFGGSCRNIEDIPEEYLMFVCRKVKYNPDVNKIFFGGRKVSDSEEIDVNDFVIELKEELKQYVKDKFKSKLIM